MANKKRSKFKLLDSETEELIRDLLEERQRRMKEILGDEAYQLLVENWDLAGEDVDPIHSLSPLATIRKFEDDVEALERLAGL